ncbi:hypothetical protein BDL97_06G097900 [Sphagnum fallax]|nr:hypothetical protein BDL97_06G097900 [Sphagnum fallax]
MEEVVSGRRTTGSLYRPPFSLPTPNPVSKSTVGMMGRGSQRGKRPLTSSWEGKIFLEVPGRGIGREGKPLPLSGSKLHAVPAPMSAAKQTVSSREPSLLLALNFSPAPSVSTGLIPKTSTATLSSPDEEWGKTLALSQMCATTPAAVRSSLSEPKHIGYQDWFVHLQAFLKKCDDDEQEDLLQALQSLSAAARNGYAVELETPAMGLSFEGKEMSRVKLLNLVSQEPISKGN